MALTGNKGEWSEVYAFFKLLADGRLYSGDGELHSSPDRYSPILRIFRDDAPDRICYKVDAGKGTILAAGKQTSIEVSQSEMARQAERLLDEIKAMKKSTAAMPDVEQFMASLHCYALKAKSSDKADIRIVIHDLRTDTRPELGYSIKSRLGSSATLINACGAGTNFIYEVTGATLADDTIEAFNSLKNFNKKFTLLDQIGASVTYCGIESPKLYNNLNMLDCSLPSLLGAALLRAYRSKGTEREIKRVELWLREANPLNFDISVQPIYYEYKLKQFLLAFALGMTPGTLWNGTFNANGGSIIVKETGDIVCYHFFDRTDFEQYLFLNTYFDTPSTKRHHFGQLYREGERVMLKLNLQVRFL